MKAWLRKAAKDEMQERREPKQFLCEICKHPIKFTTEKITQCKPLSKIKHSCKKDGTSYGLSLSLLILFLAATIFMVIKVSELSDPSLEEYYALLIGLSIVPLMLFISLVLLLKSLFVGSVIRVKEVLRRRN